VSQLANIILHGMDLGGRRTNAAFDDAMGVQQLRRLRLLDDLRVQEESRRGVQFDQEQEDRLRELTERQATQDYYGRAAMSSGMFTTPDPMSGLETSDPAAADLFAKLPPQVQDARLRAHETTRERLREREARDTISQRAHDGRVQVERIKANIKQQELARKTAAIEKYIRPKFGAAEADRQLEELAAQYEQEDVFSPEGSIDRGAGALMAPPDAMEDEAPGSPVEGLGQEQFERFRQYVAATGQVPTGATALQLLGLGGGAGDGDKVQARQARAPQMLEALQRKYPRARPEILGGVVDQWVETGNLGDLPEASISGVDRQAAESEAKAQREAWDRQKEQLDRRIKRAEREYEEVLRRADAKYTGERPANEADIDAAKAALNEAEDALDKHLGQTQPGGGTAGGDDDDALIQEAADLLGDDATDEEVLKLAQRLKDRKAGKR